VRDLDVSLLPKGATVVTADTGEFGRDFVRGLFTVDTPRAQIAAGAFLDAPLRLSAVEVHVENDMAAIAVQSMDDHPIERSREILISLTARTVPLDDAAPTFLLEPLRGTLRITGSPDLVLTTAGQPRVALSEAHTVSDGLHVVDLARVGGANWLMLREEAASTP
jgi:hypothetical protein